VPEAPSSPWRSYFAKLSGPIPWMLEAAIVLQLALGRHLEAALVAGLLVLNATLAFVQEGRAGAAVAALRRKLAPTATVRRDGEWRVLPAADLVPGDIVSLTLGAIVPADVRIVSGDVMLDQSALTGESVPAESGPGGRAFAGSLARRGRAAAEVTATGSKTYFGRAAALVQEARGPSTEQRAILGVTRNLALVNGTIAVLIVAYGFLAALPGEELVRLGLTALLATVPLALPATFTLSAALSAQALAHRGVLLTRLTAAHEAAAMDLLCADKTGTLTRNELAVVDVVPLPGFDRERVLALAALASAETGEDPIDRAVRTAAAASADRSRERLVRFVPFDPAAKISRAVVRAEDATEAHAVKGAFEALSALAQAPAEAEASMKVLAAHGHRVIAVAWGPPQSLRLAGLVAISDPPREDSARLVAALADLDVRTVMVTGDSPLTAAAIAAAVGIRGEVCGSERTAASAGECGVFARILPEQKYQIVKSLQGAGRVVGMCGDGVNDAPALRQAQFGIAVSSATDAAKAAAGAVLTEPGLAGIVHAVREGRIAFQRLLTYAMNMLVKKVEILLFLAGGLLLTGHAILTPALMVLMLMTNDFLAMSLTTDRASAASSPARWRTRGITVAALILGAGKLAFSMSVLAFGALHLGLRAGELQTLALLTLVSGAQALLYAIRERGPLWSSKPGPWVLVASAADVTIVCALALSGTLMAPLPWTIVAALLAAAAAFAFALDRVKLRVLRLLQIG
jgi:H+-transporting ATPase